MTNPELTTLAHSVSRPRVAVRCAVGPSVRRPSFVVGAFKSGAFVSAPVALYILVAVLAAAAACAGFATASLCRRCAALGRRLREMTRAKRLTPIRPDELAGRA